MESFAKLEKKKIIKIKNSKDISLEGHVLWESDISTLKLVTEFIPLVEKVNGKAYHFASLVCTVEEFENCAINGDVALLIAGEYTTYDAAQKGHKALNATFKKCLPKTKAKKK